MKAKAVLGALLLTTALSLPTAHANEGVVGRIRSYLGGVSCGSIVQGLGRYDPMNMLLDRVPVLRDVAQCRRSLAEGFLCSIPEMVSSLASMLARVAESIWNNKVACLGAGLLTMGSGTLACGLVKAYGPDVVKLGRCIAGLFSSDSVWEDIKHLLGSNEESGASLKDKIIRGACKWLGALALDVVLTVATGGGSLPATVGGWIAWAAPLGAQISGVKNLVSTAAQVRRLAGLGTAIGRKISGAIGACN